MQTSYENNSFYCGVAICDDEQCFENGNELTYKSYSDSEKSVHSIGAPPFSPIIMDGTDSDEELDIVTPATNEPCKNS